MPRAAVQIYTVLQEALDDLEGTVGRIAELGFAGVETYGLWDAYSPSQIRRALSNSGLELASAHAPFPAGADARRILDENAELGARTLVWSMEREEFDSLDALTAGLVRVNEAAENAAEYGMTIAYHNHFAEFSQTFEGRQAYDWLVERLDPRVSLELDLYWVALGGADPAEVLRRFGGRVRFIHVKDGPVTSYGNDVLVPVGQGAVDMASALSAAGSVEWHIVELERLDMDVFEALRESIDFMTAGGYTDRGASE